VTMAIATLDLCFMNPAMFERNIKIRKARAAELIMRSTNPREVVHIFKEHARSIHAKASPADPNYLRVSVACSKIEHWAEHNYPSFVRVHPVQYDASPEVSFDPADARSRIAYADEKRPVEIRERIAAGGGAPSASRSTSQGPPWDVLAMVGGGVFLVLAFSFGVVFAVLHFTA